MPSKLLFMTGTKSQRRSNSGSGRAAKTLAGTQLHLRKMDFMKSRSEAMYSSMTCWRSSIRNFALSDWGTLLPDVPFVGTLFRRISFLVPIEAILEVWLTFKS